MIDSDFLLDSYSYDLPEDRIAQFPCGEPGSSRLLVMNRKARSDGENEDVIDARFTDIWKFLPENALIVANNTRVLPARLQGKRPGGGKMEFLLLTPLPLLLACVEQAQEIGFENKAEVECLLRPSGKTRLGDKIELGPGMAAVITAKENFGRHKALLLWNGLLGELFEKYGKLPLPPYIRRQTVADDDFRYQTVYAKKTGAVAAPTAGLHFTPATREKLAAKGFEWRELTLYVGYGTFSPVRTADIRDHKMHAEYVELPGETAEAIVSARAKGRPIVAVGTTSLRTLEGVADQLNGLKEFRGWTDIFLYPGKKFQVVDALITNFHLPQSSLLMLVSAFAGRERVLNAYCKAIRLGYKFFSYGDAMLIR